MKILSFFFKQKIPEYKFFKTAFGYETSGLVAYQVYYNLYYDNAGTCRGFVTGRIGENGLKPNVTYTVKNGRFVEVTEDEVIRAISV